MSEKFPAAPRVFGTREWQSVESAHPLYALARETIIDLWLDDCEQRVGHKHGGNGVQWDNRRRVA
jgi:hypothetical protein